MQYASHSGEDMQRVAAAFAATLKSRAGGATLVLLSGQLGAGKTTFAQGMARALGVDEAVTSPTFVIEKVYQLSGQKFDRLVHIDAYRLEGAHQLEMLGWKESLADPGNLIVLEWPEKVAEALSVDAVRLVFDIRGDQRTISINDGDPKGRSE